MTKKLPRSRWFRKWSLQTPGHTQNYSLTKRFDSKTFSPTLAVKNILNVKWKSVWKCGWEDLPWPAATLEPLKTFVHHTHTPTQCPENSAKGKDYPTWSKLPNAPPRRYDHPRTFVKNHTLQSLSEPRSGKWVTRLCRTSPTALSSLSLSPLFVVFSIPLFFLSFFLASLAQLWMIFCIFGFLLFRPFCRKGKVCKTEPHLILIILLSLWSSVVFSIFFSRLTPSEHDFEFTSLSALLPSLIVSSSFWTIFSPSDSRLLFFFLFPPPSHFQWHWFLTFHFWLVTGRLWCCAFFSITRKIDWSFGTWRSSIRKIDSSILPSKLGGTW